MTPSKVCEHIYEAEDPKHPGYSLTEVDLYPAVGSNGEAYSTRRNHDTEHYEIFNHQHENAYSDESVIFANEEIERMIDYAHMLEEDATGSSSFKYDHREWMDKCRESQWSSY
jgi:hypothetical protein